MSLINLLFNPPIMHAYAIEAIKVPKVDLTSKTESLLSLLYK